MVTIQHYVLQKHGKQTFFCMSIFLILLQIFLLRLIFKKLNFPEFISFIIVGILNGRDLLNLIPSFLNDSYNIISLIALIVIFVRASSQIKIKLYTKKNFHIILLGILPGCLEIISTILLCRYFTPLNFHESIMLGFIITAVSPAVVVPLMIELQKQKIGEKNKIPSSILAAASLDDMFAIIGFSVIVFFYFGFNSIIYNQLINISLIIIIFILVRLIKNKRIVKNIENLFSKIWFLISIMLFICVGSFLDFNIVKEAGLIGILIIFFGIVFRSIGVLICLFKTKYSKIEKLFFVVSLIPKATVQAALGAIPLSLLLKMNSCTIPGYWILSIAMIGIIITAPIGAYLISIVSKKI